MKGIILAGGSGTRLYPITKGILKYPTVYCRNKTVLNTSKTKTATHIPMKTN